MANRDVDIYLLVVDCREILENLGSQILNNDQPNSKRLADALQHRLNAWGNYLGVSAPESTSLDRRLDNAPKVKELFTQSLSQLHRTLQTYNRSLAEAEHPLSDNDADRHLLYEAAERTIDRLERLGQIIRRSPIAEIQTRMELFAENHANLLMEDLSAMDVQSKQQDDPAPVQTEKTSPEEELSSAQRAKTPPVNPLSAVDDTARLEITSSHARPSDLNQRQQTKNQPDETNDGAIFSKQQRLDSETTGKRWEGPYWHKEKESWYNLNVDKHGDTQFEWIGKELSSQQQKALSSAALVFDIPLLGGDSKNTIPVTPNTIPVTLRRGENYHVEHSSKWRKGEVIKCLVAEPSGYQDENEPPLTQKEEYRPQNSMEGFRIGPRRFIIVKTSHGRSTCVPIHTYSGQGLSRSGITPGTHSIVYNSSSKPLLLPTEPEPGYPPIPVDMTSNETLTPESRVDYSNLKTFEHNVPVVFIGSVPKHAQSIITQGVDECWADEQSAAGSSRTRTKPRLRQRQ